MLTKCCFSASCSIFLPCYKSVGRKEGNTWDSFVGLGLQVLYPGSYSCPLSWESVPDIRNSLSPLLSIPILVAFICRAVALTWQRSWAVFFRCCYCIAAELANVSLISFWHPAWGNMQWAISSNIVSVGNSYCPEPATWSKQGTVWFWALMLWNRNWNTKSSSVLECLFFPRGHFKWYKLIPHSDVFLEFPYTVAISTLFTEYCIVYQTCANILLHGKERHFRKQNQTRQDGIIFLSV